MFGFGLFLFGVYLMFSGLSILVICWVVLCDLVGFGELVLNV